MRTGLETVVTGARRGLVRSALVLSFLIVGAGQGLAQENGSPCEDQILTGGTLGIGLFQCAGGACILYRPAGPQSSHGFSVEPRVWELSEPARGRLKDGDIILSIDDILITTRNGGRRLASVDPGQSVELRVRRGKHEKTVSLTALEGCERSRLVQTTQIPPDISAD